MSENIISGQSEEFPLLSKKINVCTSNKNRSDKCTNTISVCIVTTVSEHFSPHTKTA